jgi:uncharacterized protein with HEPN domain
LWLGSISLPSLKTKKTTSAVERELQKISEAAVRLGKEAEQLCPGVPWADIRGMGNWLRHQYERVDLETIWTTVERDMANLKSAVQLTLTSLPTSSEPSWP